MLLLNGETISSARQFRQVHTFSFSDGDVVQVKEVTGVIRLNSISFSCPAPTAAAQTCADVWDTLADGYSCGSRIEWVVANLDSTEAEAKAQVGSEFPNDCGACASITAAPASDAPTATPNPGGDSQCSSITMPFFTSKQEMETAGWVFSWSDNYDFKGVLCDSTPRVYCGFFERAVGEITLQLAGSGSATVDYGNIYGSQTVTLYLNDDVLSTATSSSKIEEFSFQVEYQAADQHDSLTFWLLSGWRYFKTLRGGRSHGHQQH